MLEREPLARGHAIGTEEREFPFSPADFRAIAAMLRDQTGITLSESKAPLVYGRLAKRLRALHFADFADYVAHVASPAGVGERRHLLTSMTTNVTRFFREPHHFEHLRTDILPALLADRPKRGRTRLWSAACSTGQEAYSIAAVLACFVPDLERSDVKVLATDIDPVVLEHARTGRYETLDGVPPALRGWFHRDGEVWTVDPVLRRLIAFKSLNLNGPWPVRGPFDAVFCCNVAIYFDQDRQARLWSAFADVIRPGGVLYIGHSERMGGNAAAAFEKIGTTTYRRRSSLP